MLLGLREEISRLGFEEIQLRREDRSAIYIQNTSCGSNRGTKDRGRRESLLYRGVKDGGTGGGRRGVGVGKEGWSGRRGWVGEVYKQDLVVSMVRMAGFYRDQLLHGD